MASKEATVTMKVKLEPSDELRELLQDIRDRLPAPAVTVVQDSPPGGWPRYWAQRGGAQFGATTEAPKGSGLAAAKRAALQAVLEALDGWIEGAQSNHESSDHRNENRGDECWRSFAPSDFRHMINDAARELGLAEFPLPAYPKENTK